jgi:hypothetical protein
LFQHLDRMPSHPVCGDHETPVGALIAQSHRCDAGQASTIQQIGGTTCLAAQPKPVKRGSATGLEVRLIPHADNFPDVAL